jgi:hypothetical protein
MIESHSPSLIDASDPRPSRRGRCQGTRKNGEHSRQKARRRSHAFDAIKTLGKRPRASWTSAQPTRSRQPADSQKSIGALAHLLPPKGPPDTTAAPADGSN